MPVLVFLAAFVATLVIAPFLGSIADAIRAVIVWGFVLTVLTVIFWPVLSVVFGLLP
ncbi:MULTISPECIES: hypothetical protein [Kytococcus]|mgnify:CR=1 FL=1|uniref:hypothetical protein n=1 Tax=Kytococcus TaxID=57499 RepID=UPI00143A5723|nr:MULTISPECIES: hypothetical protein [Kytococcus]